MLYDVNDAFADAKKHLVERLIICGLEYPFLDQYSLSDYLDARKIPNDIKPVTDEQYKTFEENLEIDNYNFISSKIKRYFVNYFFTKNLINNV
jgi:hypothetical protein